MIALSSSSQSLDPLFVSGKIDLFSFVDIAKDTLCLDAIEIEDKHFAERSTAYVKKVKDACVKKGLAVSNLAFFNSFGYPTKAENDAQLAAAFEWMDIAKILGLSYMRIFAGWMGGNDPEIGLRGSVREKSKEAWDTMVDYLMQACAGAQEKSLELVIENHNHGGFLSQSADVKKLFAELGAPNLSLLLDTGNYADGIPGIRETVKLAKRHIHLKCRNIQGDGRDADFDLDTIIDIIIQSGFSGNLSLEYEGSQDPLLVLPKLTAFVRTKLR